MISSVKNILEKRKKELLRKHVENESIDKQIDSYENSNYELIEKLKVGQSAVQFLEDVANSRRYAMKSQIENIVSEALKLIYGDAYSIELVYDVKNNRSFMDIELVKNTFYGDVHRNMNGFGGGVSDTISVPLRLLIILASRQTDRVCVLDECWKHMDGYRIERVANFIQDITSRLGMQIIMFSHHEIMKEYADLSYKIVDDNGKAIISKYDFMFCN